MPNYYNPEEYGEMKREERYLETSGLDYVGQGEDEPNETPTGLNFNLNGTPSTRNRELIERAERSGQMDKPLDESKDASPWMKDEETGKLSQRVILMNRQAGRLLVPKDIWVLAMLTSKTDEHGESHITMDELSELTDVPNRTLSDVIHRLADMKFIEIEQKTIVSDKSAIGVVRKNYYRVLVPKDDVIFIDTVLFDMPIGMITKPLERGILYGLLMLVKCYCNEGTNLAPYSMTGLYGISKIGKSGYSEHFKTLENHGLITKGQNGKTYTITIHVAALNKDVPKLLRGSIFYVPEQKETDSFHRLKLYSLLNKVLYRAIFEWCEEKGLPCPLYDDREVTRLHVWCEMECRREAIGAGIEAFTFGQLFSGLLRGVPSPMKKMVQLLDSLEEINENTRISSIGQFCEMILRHHPEMNDYEPLVKEVIR